MSVLIPRLDRQNALALIAEAKTATVQRLLEELPFEAPTTLAPVGLPMPQADLIELRLALLEIARAHGFPGKANRPTLVAFDHAASFALRAGLPISPHEASSEEVWNYITCCLLLDVALWRFGADADTRRLIGDVNRNTFRRLWWRSHILGGDERSDAVLRQLAEDELVNIMERPTLARDPALVKAIALVFVERLLECEAVGRMLVMRDLTKRVLRLTPFTDFMGLPPSTVTAIVNDQLDRSLAALQGRPEPRPSHPAVDPAPARSKRLRSEPATPNGSFGTDRRLTPSQLEDLALEFTNRTGRITNGSLRELVAGLSSPQARAVLNALVEQGRLERRGEKRGSHYVTPGQSSPMPARTNRSGMLRRLLSRTDDA